MTTTLIQQEEEVKMRVFYYKNIVDILDLEGHLVKVPIALQVHTKIEKLYQGEIIFKFFLWCHYLSKMLPLTDNGTTHH